MEHLLIFWNFSQSTESPKLRAQMLQQTFTFIFSWSRIMLTIIREFLRGNRVCTRCLGLLLRSLESCFDKLQTVQRPSSNRQCDHTPEHTVTSLVIQNFTSKDKAKDIENFQGQLQGQAKICIATTDKIDGRNSKYWGIQNCLQSKLRNCKINIIDLKTFRTFLKS